MEIVRLEPEAEAPAGSDCIKINLLPDGTFRIVTSALFEGDSNGDESVSVIGGDTYATHEAAEAAGLTWADEQGGELLHVETSRSPGSL